MICLNGDLMVFSDHCSRDFEWQKFFRSNSPGKTTKEKEL